MAAKLSPRFSIRYKFLSAMSLLLGICVLTYLSIATITFREDKERLVYDLNKNMVLNLASEVETQFKSYSDKLTLFALLHDKSESIDSIVQDLLKTDRNIAYVSLAFSSTPEKTFKAYFNEDFLETYGVQKDFFEKDLATIRPIPFNNIQQSGQEIWNATIENGPPLIGFGRSVLQEGKDGNVLQRWAVVSYIRIDSLLKAMSDMRSSEIFLTNERGELLAHPKIKELLDFKNSLKRPLVLKAVESPTKLSIGSFKIGTSHVFGGFSKSFGEKLIVLSQMPKQRAFEVVDTLLIRSLMVSLFVVTLAFLFSLFFSRSLTQPLEVLMKGMAKVSEGDLTTNIKVSTSDEISVLADSFNTMIKDLKNSRNQLEDINRDLEKKVIDRTQKLNEQNRAIKEAQEAMIRTSRLAAIGEIAGNAAHEVLNPLTSLLTRVKKVQNRFDTEARKDASLLKEITTAWSTDFSQGGFDTLVSNWKSPSTLDPKKSLWDEDIQNVKAIVSQWEAEIASLRQDTDFVINEAQRINKIVSGMRELSIVRAELAPNSAHTLLKECINIMGDLYAQSQINITLEANTEYDEILVDKDEFIQSITNLLRNSQQSIKSSANPNGKVTIRTILENRQFVIEISDNGGGISKENHSKILKTQFTTKSSEEGTGLGLGISRRFIRAFGGELEFVGSTPNVSTTFKIRLPAQHSNEGAVA